MPEQGGEAGSGQLGGEFVLAAGDGENCAGLPANRLGQGVVGRRVTRMQGDDQVDRSRGLKTGDGSLFELQPGTAQACGDLTAVGDDIGPQVEAGDVDFASEWSRQPVVQGEREIAFATAKIDDAQGATLGQFGEQVVDEFQEAVDLAELGLPGAANLPLGCHHPNLHEEGAGSSFGEWVAGLAVVGGGKRGWGHDWVLPQGAPELPALSGWLEGDPQGGGVQLRLAELGGQAKDLGPGGPAGQVAVRGLGGGKQGNLPVRFPADNHRFAGDPADSWRGGGERVGQYQPGLTAPEQRLERVIAALVLRLGWQEGRRRCAGERRLGGGGMIELLRGGLCGGVG